MVMVENTPISDALVGQSGRATPSKSKANLRLVVAPPKRDNGTVARSSPPRRQRNEDRRTREHLSDSEVETLIRAVRVQNRYPDRDAAAVWLAFNHGFRVSELCDLRWGDIRWADRVLHARRLKGSRSGDHPLTGRDMRVLGPLKKAAGVTRPADHVFVNERGGALSAAGFRKMLSRLRLPDDLAALAVHPHMLRHSAGYAIGQKADVQVVAHYLGHRRLDNAARYRYIGADQFDGLMD